MATLILARRHGEPLGKVAYCEVMFDRDTSGEVPEHREFIHHTAIPKLKSWGIETVILRDATTYVDNVTQAIKRGPKAGMIRGFPLCGRCAIQRDCKKRPISRWIRRLPEDTVQYIGIASDEQERLARLRNGKQISLLDKYGVDEAGAYELCRQEGLLSPIYGFSDRNGCFFCPNAKTQELRHLYEHHPDLWAKMLALQALPNKPTELFNRSRTFEEIDAQFRQMDGCIHTAVTAKDTERPRDAS